MTPRRVAAAAALLFLAFLFCFAQWRQTRAPLHRDEVEYLHATWRMAHGERLFTDFFEHHSPLFFALLLPFAPAGNTVPEIEDYVVSARLFFAVFTAIALASAAAVVWRAAGHVAAPIVFIAMVFMAGPVWRNGLGDVRAEAPGLALWWLGAVLLLDVLTERHRGVLHGVGIGLVFLAALLNPKWPLGSIVLGLVFLVSLRRMRAREWMTSLGVAAAIAVAGVAALLPFTTLRDYYDWVFRFSAGASAWSRTMAGHEPMTFWGCPPLFRPLEMLPALLLVVLALVLKWRTGNPACPSPDRQDCLSSILLALALSTLIEVRIIYPFPAVDFRYYTFWVVIAAALIGLAPIAAAALIRTYTSFARLARAIPVAAVVLALIGATTLVVPKVPERDTYWIGSEWLHAHLAPGESVWMSTLRHPIGLRDATYYWFGFYDVMPAALRMKAPFLPKITERDLPPCRIERGLDPAVRYIARSYGEYFYMSEVAGCFDRLRASGRLERTPVPDLWRVRPAGAVTIPPPQR